MKKINKPVIKIKEKSVYEACVNAYCSKVKQNRLKQYAELVNNISREYDTNMADDFEKISNTAVPDDVKDELISIYDYQIVDKRLDDIYDSIMNGANYICPFCGEGIPRNIDHFLPKSAFPLLAVTPENLVPSCRDCNMEKNAIIPRKNDEVPLHPYYDDVAEIWLGVNLDFSNSQCISAEYYNCLDKNVYTKLSNRIDSHIQAHGLQTNYATHASSLINSKKRIHKKIALKSVEDLLQDMKEELSSFEEDDINSWRSALFRELIKEVDVYSKWLEGI